MKSHDCITERASFERTDSGDTLATCEACGRTEKIPAGIGAKPQNEGLASRVWSSLQEQNGSKVTAREKRLAKRAIEIQQQADADCARILVVLVAALAVIWFMA